MAGSYIHTQDETKRITLWHTRITMTQAPEPFIPHHLPEEAVPFYQKREDIRTFLYDPFGGDPPKTYGLELSSNENVKVRFFTQAESKEAAIKSGYAWLSNLKYKFRGLDGTVEAVSISNQEHRSHDNLLEIVLPNGFIKSKIRIVERLINAFFYLKDHKVHLYLLWRREPTVESSEEGPNLFNVRIFVEYCKENLTQEEKLKLEGILEFLAMDIENQEGQRAHVITPDNITHLSILKGTIFKDENETYRTFIPEDVNFDFPEKLPLPRLPILKNENVRYIDINDKFKRHAVRIGHHIKDGVTSDHETFLSINKLPQDLAIFGKSGSGKTYFLAHFINELASKAKRVGILVLNVAKESQEIFYHDFKKLKYSDEKFCIPYFIDTPKEILSKRLQETATYICASLGLKNVFEKIIYRSEVGFFDLKGRLPEYFIGLLRGVETYIINNPYGPEEQANLLQIFRNRMNTFDEDKVQNVLKLTRSLPQWVDDWLNGENIFLDLSICSKFVKMLIVNAIFQLVRSLTEDNEAEELKYLIVIDEAHAILEKQITTNSDDADFIMKEQMAKIFSELLKEYRSRGVGFVIADQSPARLFDDVVSQPSIKFIFREDYPNNLLFSEDSVERQILTVLENRLSLVINGATGEKYLIKTLDYTI